MIIDTNVLLEYPDLPKNEKDLIIPMTVLEELDTLKTKRYSAREVLRNILNNEDSITIIDNLKYCQDKCNDNNILMEIKEFLDEHDIKDEILYTNDFTMFLKAKTFGVPCKIYKNKDVEFHDPYILNLSDDEVNYLYSDISKINIPRKDRNRVYPYIICRDSNNNKIDLLKYNFKEQQYHSIFKEFLILKSSYFGAIKPKDIYQKCLFNSLINDDVTFITGSAGSGKEQPVDTLTPTPNGMKKFGDLKIGDYVYDRLGKPTKVIGIYPQGIKDVYEISLIDGRKVKCGYEHLWTFYDRNNKLKTKSLKDMINDYSKTYISNNSEHINYKYKIPINQAVEKPEKLFDIDPYIIGCFLGDGCCTQSALEISSENEEIPKEIARILKCNFMFSKSKNYSWNFYYNEKKGQGKKYKIQTKELFNKYKDNICCLCQEKSIPEEYKNGSIQQRLDLLQGLFDTDGCIKNNKSSKYQVSFSTTSLKLANDVREVLFSLGYSNSMSIDSRDLYTIYCKISNQEKYKLFRLNRKLKLALEAKDIIQKKEFNKVSISSIKKLDEVAEMICIEVDNTEHLYLTNDYIVTHNTLISLAYCMQEIEKNNYDKLIVFTNQVPVKDSQDIGFLPGNKYDKLLNNNIGNILGSKFGDICMVEQLIQQGKLDVFPFSSIRGMEVSKNQIMYISEMQNSSIQLAKLAIQRAQEGAKIIFEGDIDTQVDMLQFENSNNGLRRSIEVLGGYEGISHIHLKKIYRSRIAGLAELL